MFPLSIANKCKLGSNVLPNDIRSLIVSYIPTDINAIKVLYQENPKLLNAVIPGYDPDKYMSLFTTNNPDTIENLFLHSDDKTKELITNITENTDNRLSRAHYKYLAESYSEYEDEEHDKKLENLVFKYPYIAVVGDFSTSLDYLATITHDHEPDVNIFIRAIRSGTPVDNKFAVDLFEYIMSRSRSVYSKITTKDALELMNLRPDIVNSDEFDLDSVSDDDTLYNRALELRSK